MSLPSAQVMVEYLEGFNVGGSLRSANLFMFMASMAAPVSNRAQRGFLSKYTIKCIVTPSSFSFDDVHLSSPLLLVRGVPGLATISVRR